MSEKKDETIKLMYNVNCPECNEDIIISIALIPPWLNWILSKKNINKAKEKVRQQLKTIKFFDEKERKEATEWLEDKNNIFGPEDTDAVIYQLINKHAPATKNKTE